MPELNPVAVTSADFLRAIQSDGWTTKAELAELAGRQRNNMARDLKIVSDAGLVEINPDKSPRQGIVLTDHGREQLAAIARAEHGGEKRKPRGRWPVDRIIRNPANRMPRDADVAALADTIESAEDVLQDVLLTPPDANGVRMLLAGEHRWRAVLLLAEQDRLPPALAEGLPFRERQASAADQILIRIVENTARADLSPLEDARLLRDLQVQTNWSAREIAKKTGRSPADSDTGVRDVQVKIKVAKEATPEAIAEYERTGSWDALRDSVTEKKPRPTPEQELSQALAESGPAVLGAGGRPQQAVEAGIEKVWNTDQITHAREQGWEPDRQLTAADPAAASADPLVVNGHRYPNLTRANEARRTAGILPRQANSGGGGPKPPGELTKRPEPAAAESGIVVVEKASTESSGILDIWDRDHNAIVADEATLQRVTDFTLGHTGHGTPGYAHQLLAAVGLEGPFGADEGGNILSDVVGGLQPRAFATIDVDAEGPPQRARAIALLVAWALNRIFNAERAS